MEKAQNRLSIVPYAGITQIRCGRSLTLPLRLYTDSHTLYGHMIAQNKKNVKETAYRKEQEIFPAPNFLYSYSITVYSVAIHRRIDS